MRTERLIDMLHAILKTTVALYRKVDIRTPIKSIIASVLLVTTLGHTVWSQDPYPPSIVPDRIVLNLTATPAKSMAVTWRTALYVRSGYVEYTLADPSPEIFDSTNSIKALRTAFTSDLNASHHFSAVMEDLDPETMYAYRVGDSTNWSEWFHFETASNKQEPVSFIYLGDAQNELKSKWSRCIRDAFQQMPRADFILHAGDLIDQRQHDEEWGEWFYAGGWIHGMIPSIATPGNHEYGRNPGGSYTLTKHWRPTFTLPENGPAGLEETVFSVDYQGIRFISLDSPAFLYSEAAREAQIKWLTNVLKTNNQKWTIVTLHHPIYSTKGGRDNIALRTALQPLFEEYQVDLVLQGHDHSYGRGSNLPLGDGVRTPAGGPIYVVSVSGPKMYEMGTSDWMQRGASNVQLYQLVYIDGDVLKHEAYTVGGDIYDAFELTKQSDGKNLFVDTTPKGVKDRYEIPKQIEMRFNNKQRKEYRTRFQAFKTRMRKAGK